MLLGQHAGGDIPLHGTSWSSATAMVTPHGGRLRLKAVRRVLV